MRIKDKKINHSFQPSLLDGLIDCLCRIQLYLIILLLDIFDIKRKFIVSMQSVVLVTKVKLQVGVLLQFQI